MRPAIEFIKKYFDGKELNGVEIGVEDGLNAEDIVNSLKIKKLLLIDIWAPYIREGIFIDYTEKYENVIQKFKQDNRIIIKRQSSVIASKNIENESLDFVYIDACHQYEFVKEDIEAWFPKVKKGGIISGHDYEWCWQGVVKAVNEFVNQHNLKLNIKHLDWWIIK